MKKLCRRLLNALTVLSLLLCAAAVVAWLIPFHGHAGGVRYFGVSRACTLMAGSPGLVITLGDYPPAPFAVRYERVTWAADERSAGPRRGWAWESFQWLADHPLAADRRAPQLWAGTCIGWQIIAVREHLWAGTYTGWEIVRVRYVRLGYIWLIGAFAIPPATRLLNMTRRWRRAKAGVCTRCSYDLTGNVSGVCPECGTAVAKANA